MSTVERAQSPCLCRSVASRRHQRIVISTEAAHRLIVSGAVEKPALSEVEWDPRISSLNRHNAQNSNF